MRNNKNNPLPLYLILLVLSTVFYQCQMEEELEPETLISASGKNDDDDDDDDDDKYDCDCDHVVKGYFNDGKKMGIEPGDIICLKGKKKYNRLLFQNIVGTESKPVIIKNCGGVAEIVSKDAFGVKFENSKHFKLQGNGSGDRYGIKITTDVGFYLSMERFTTNFEISNVEIAGSKSKGKGGKSGFAGIAVKTSPYQDCRLFADPTRTAWVMRDIQIKDNYIHDTGGEGLYIGHGFYSGRKESRCGNVTYSHSIENVEVQYNRIENVGYDGIQIKNTDKKVSVHDNIIKNYGQRNVNGHNEGLFIGEGAIGDYYNNYIDNGTGNGIRVQGLGNLNIYNNVVARSGQTGIFVSSGEYAPRLKNGYFYFANNTICDANDHGIKFYGSDGGHKAFVNNLVVNTRHYIDGENGVDMESNIYIKNIDDAGFVNYRNGDFHLKSSSIAKDKGYDLRPYQLFSDFDGNRRPKGNKFDVGAFEQ